MNITATDVETRKGTEAEKESLPDQATAKILEGQMIILFAFDVGYEVLLDKLSALFASMPVQLLSQKKKTPSFLQYARPPHVLNLGASEAIFGSVSTAVVARAHCSVEVVRASTAE
jgi:hypothetical protein